MIIGRGESKECPNVLILGLSKENVDRLKAGKPIYLTQRTHGQSIPNGWAISIMYGDTEGAIAAKLQAEGVLTPESKIHVDPRLNQS